MAKQTIKLKKYGDIINEYPAEEVLSPGHLLEMTATNTVQLNTNAAVKPAMIVALEDELQGRTIEDAFAAGEPVQCWMLQPGEEVLLRGGAAIAAGARVETNATGGVVTLAAGVAVGVCLEAITEAGFVKIRII